jgi:hypothetical protein
LNLHLPLSLSLLGTPGSAYFVAHDPNGLGHHNAPNGGYLCEKQILSVRAQAGETCEDINADTIDDIQVCARAAQETEQTPYASDAGPEWAVGCIVNGGSAYFSDPQAVGTHDHVHDGGSICLQRTASSVCAAHCDSSEADSSVCAACHMAADMCGDWDCSHWCEYYETKFDDVYAAMGCADDSTDTCECK